MATVATKTRDSNMELLRITAMVLVMVVHANFRALPMPGMVKTLQEPTSSLLMFMTEGFAICAVDLFVLLSGWYGIRFKGWRLAELLFQVFFFGLVAIGACLLFTPAELSHDVLSRLFLLKAGDLWFVKAYIGLYLLAPVLNAFVERATRREFAIVLLSFYAFQFVYGWIYEGTSWFRAGYSLPSFIGLYLLARYMRLHPCRLWRLSRWVDLGIYLLTVAVLTVSMYVIKRHGGLGGYLYFYNCPLVMLAAMHLLLFFSKFSFRSRLVNWVAVSVFAVYLVQSSSFLWNYHDDLIRRWFNNEPRFEFIIYSAGLLAALFAVSILVDKLRLAVWHGVEYSFEAITNKIQSRNGRQD